MKPDLSRWVPPGFDAGRELRWIGGGLVASALLSLTFFSAYNERYYHLFLWENGGQVLIENAWMVSFTDLLGVSLFGFALLALCMAGLAAFHYASYYQGSRSIYLMRRLPRRRELWRRCFALPGAAALLSLTLGLGLLALFFHYYLTRTPPACMQPGQWPHFWGH